MARGRETAPAGSPRGIAAVVTAVLGDAVDYVGRHRRAYAAVWAATLVASMVIYPWDAPLLRQIQELGAGHRELAIWLSEIGRFENSTVVLTLALGIGALLTRRPSFRQAAVACLMAGIMAGLAVTVLRPGIGRARPHSQLEPGFYWLELRPDLHSMPSGHAASNTASAAAVAMVMPAVGVPASLVAAGICWSRLELDQHYPTDVLWGAVLGGSIGIAIGGPLRRGRDRSTGSAQGR
jgi:membrane-associated phospholipid phosphatase